MIKIVPSTLMPPHLVEPATQPIIMATDNRRIRASYLIRKSSPSTRFSQNHCLGIGPPLLQIDPARFNYAAEDVV